MRRIVKVMLEVEFEVTPVTGEELQPTDPKFADDVAFSVYNLLEDDRSNGYLSPYYARESDSDAVVVKFKVASPETTREYIWEHWDIMPLRHVKKGGNPTPVSE